MSHSGRMPAALKIGGSVRFRRDEITAWIASGCHYVNGRAAV
jgi:predicted DNA-binding transcriptional regulator AlpA